MKSLLIFKKYALFVEIREKYLIGIAIWDFSSILRTTIICGIMCFI